MKTLLLFILTTFSAAIAGAGPITFTFSVREEGGNPFAREIWAEVATPSGRTLTLPAFHTGEKASFAVHVRPNEVGIYSIGNVTEVAAGETRTLRPRFQSPKKATNKTALALPSVGLDPNDRRRFLLSDGRPYLPIGANLPWSLKDGMSYYRKELPIFGRERLNWIRVWMSHWGGLNLDWLPDDWGRSPAPGILNARAAANWDELLALAEKHGVYVQVVLQHHGQFSTQVNPNWKDHPWNVANGGFLATPSEFFTSLEARRLTKLKYRYSVARWSWSPAVMVWELFNEVHWVDALRLDKNEAVVAAWHTEMAAYLRSIDPYKHLVTTSTDDLRSPIYAAMDYYQPHLYAANMLAGTRRFDLPAELVDRPIFYGEAGDDHQLVTAKQKEAGAGLVGPVWSGLMGEGELPVQIWYVERLLDRNRIGELGAVARFLDATRWVTRGKLDVFSAATRSDLRVPLTISGGYRWRRRAEQTLEVPVDGSQPLQLADVPNILVGAPESLKDGYTPRITFKIDYAKPATARIRMADASAGGARARVTLDGVAVASHEWPAPPPPPPGPDGKPVKPPPPPRLPPRPAELSFTVPAGARTIVVENDGGPDWFEFTEIDFGLGTSALAAIGKRRADFAALWVWRRDAVFALEEAPAVSGAVILENWPAGRWTVTWWDAIRGVAGESVAIQHDGGTLELPTPPISRHAVVVLTR